MNACFTICILCFLIPVCSTEVRKRSKRQTTCDERYSSIREDHTMCLVDSPFASPVELTADDKEAIVDRFNLYRSLQPGQTSMLDLVWDDEIATVAAKTARQCSGYQERFYQRWIPDLPGVEIGQTNSNGFDTFLSAIDAWYSQSDRFVYGSSTNGAVSFFTQMVNENVARIGCGQASCMESGRTRNYYICNFARGQTNRELAKPYCSSSDSSVTCLGCLRRKSNNLCDCRGKICLNSGILNPETCECNCPDNGYYTGPMCETLSCPSQDTNICTRYTPDDCDRAPSFMSECPVLCGVCPRVCTRQCLNNGTQNTIPCTCNCGSRFTGQSCELEVKDGGFSEWSEWNSATAPCPVSCGTNAVKQVNRTRTCNNPAPQNGGKDCEGVKEQTKLTDCNLTEECPPCTLDCLNGGFRDVVECVCRCSSRYTGDVCQLEVIDGGYSAWGAWNTESVQCQATCGLGAMKTVRRRRTCNSPAPKNGGRQCEGDNRQSKKVNCRLSECPNPQSCDPRYSSIRQDHTMCGEDHSSASHVHLTDDAIQAIVDKHNELRQLQRGIGMMHVEWDEELAVVAAKWARQCRQTGHDTFSQRFTPNLPGVYLGQNAAFGYSNFEAAIDAWYNEIRDFSYGVGAINNAVVLHYTQIVNEDVSRIGCGQATCGGRGNYICNYAKGQGGPTALSRPYCSASNPSLCTSCLKQTPQGLCDCGGKVCLNSGELNRSTCECSCTDYFTGPTCEILSCPTRDSQVCNDITNCERFPNYMSVCPNLCGICPETCDRICLNGGVQNTVSCTCHCPFNFTGSNCQNQIIDGGFSEWSQWSTVSSCSATCGNSGLERVSRYRTCDNPLPRNEGLDCDGDTMETDMAICNLPLCSETFMTYFVVDSSKSIGEANFILVKNALKVFVNQTISRNSENKIGLVFYSNNVTVSITASSNITSINTQIDAVEYAASGTFTDLGINMAREFLESDTSRYPRVMIVVTDGVSNQPNETRLAAEKAKASAITIFALGIDAAVRNIPDIYQNYLQELEDIASSNETVYHLDSFALFAQSVTEIISRLSKTLVFITSRLNDTTMRVGSSLVLRTSLNRLNVTNGIWRLGTRDLTTDSRYTKMVDGYDQMLIIPDVQLQDAGLYRFTIAGVNTAATLTVLGLISNETVTKGENGQLEIVVMPANAKEGYWTRSGYRITSAFSKYFVRSIGLLHQLVIRKASVTDEGLYTYTVNGVESTGYLTVFVDVVNGSFSNWGPWNYASVECPRTCGTGSLKLVSRTRTCSNPYPSNGGRDCQGDLTQAELQNCNLTLACPIDGRLTTWTQWSATDCPVTCGFSPNGVQRRTRSCTNPAPSDGGRNCTGVLTEEKRIACFPRHCPIDGNLSAWTTWETTCGVSCGPSNVTGESSRRRFCNNPPVQNGGADCIGDLDEKKNVTCVLKPCPVDGVWGLWSSWKEECFETCGRRVSGIQIRTRQCDNPPASNGGRGCNGTSTDAQPTVCQLRNCPVPGGFSEWTGWREISCAASCGIDVTSVEERTRQCDCPLPQYGGANCTGDFIQRRNGNCSRSVECPVDGNWSEWGDWFLACGDLTCGTNITGVRSRSRLCINPPASGGGRPCLGENFQTIEYSCSHPRCPVDGGWTSWSDWSDPPCEDTCRPSVYQTESRTRSCTSPPPEFGGRNCEGSNLDTRERDCAIDRRCAVHGGFSSWTSWTIQPCPATCGRDVNKTKWRRRDCDDPRPNNGGRGCVGEPIETTSENCNLTECPVDCFWSTWSSWSEPICPSNCRISILQTETRSRSKVGPEFGGQDCIGPSIDTRERDCAVHRGCPVNGGYGLWGEWSQDGLCSTTCGAGTQNYRRERLCDDPAPLNNGLSCIGDPSETVIRDCNPGPCPVNCLWTPWTNWNNPPCEDTCRSSVLQTETRTRARVGPEFGGLDCVGSSNDTRQRDCATQRGCPVNGGYGLWGVWSQVGSCSTSCGAGTQNYRRERLCDDPAPLNNGLNCVGDPSETVIRDCNPGPCQSDCIWNTWNPWSSPECDENCRPSILQVEIRTRTQSGPLNGGQPCPGSPTETRQRDCALERLCAVNGGYGVWGVWSQDGLCSTTCGAGTQNYRRERLCDDPAPLNNGLNCVGDPSETVIRDCNLGPCPSDCVWNSWNPWSNPECLENCRPSFMQEETRTRTRAGPTIGGQACPGSPTERRQRDCALERLCPVNGEWSSWSSWMEPPCPQDCRPSVMLTETRNRTCDGRLNGGEDCPGSATESRDMDCAVDRSCPVNGGLSDWSQWVETVCSVTCQGGFKRLVRQRTCTDPQPSNGGTECDGTTEETKSSVCNIQPCNQTVDGMWSSWTEWSKPPCQENCRVSVLQEEIRTRTCNGPFNGGRSCEGLSRDSRMRDCATQRGCPVHGIYGTWSEWLPYNECSATCGNGQQQYRRSRECNNPAPMNNGRTCQGEAMETEARLCSLGECNIPGLCNSTQKIDGIGYRYHPTECDHYIQCYFSPSGEVIGVYRSCPFGQFWDEASLKCKVSTSVSCPREKCRERKRMNHGMQGSNRAYWQCVDKYSVPKCCPEGFSYVSGRGCRATYTTDGSCIDPYLQRCICYKRPLWSDSNLMYEVKHDDQIWRIDSCPPSSPFDVLDCGCKQAVTCKAIFTMNFDTTLLPEGVIKSTVNIKEGVAAFNDNTGLSLDFPVSTLLSAIRIDITYKETTPLSGHQVLLRVICDNTTRVVLSLGTDDILFAVHSEYGERTMSLSTSGIPTSVWKILTVVHDLHQLTGKIEAGNIKYISRFYAPLPNIFKCHMIVGNDGSLSTEASFMGDVEQMTVYPCDAAGAIDL